MKLPLLLVSSAALPLLVAGQGNTTGTTTTAPLVTATAPPGTLVPLGTPAPLVQTSNNATVTPTLPQATLAPACTSSVDCGEGLFCSTSTGQCMATTCASWAQGTPLGQNTYSEAPCTAEGWEAGTAFCGWDGKCYAYNCLNWYTYGPVQFTSYDPRNPVPLTCTEYANGAQDNMNSVTFGCRPWQPGNKAPESKSWTHFFNYECVATPRGNDQFKCYQNVPNTDYREGGVARLNPLSCDREIYDNDNEQPLYWYIGLARQERKGIVTNYKQGRENTLSGYSFNQNLAEKTFYAVVISESDAPPQTFPEPTTFTPEEPPSGASNNSRFLTATCMGIVGFLLL